MEKMSELFSQFMESVQIMDKEEEKREEAM